MKKLKSLLIQVLAFCLTLPIAAVGLLARGIYEGLKLGWRMPELVAMQRTLRDVESALKKMDKR